MMPGKAIGSLQNSILVLILFAFAPVQAEPMPSWQDTATRQAIVSFVDAVSSPSSPHFVPARERLAVFDNDGTLWSEQPFYFQLFFAIDRIKALAPQHPEWQTTQPFRAALDGDFPTLLAGGEQALLELVMASHAGNTTEEFATIVRDWIATARHPRFDRPFTDLVYQPMAELLAYLREHGFQTWIVSGGGIEFMRPWTQAVYGVPPEQVIGSSIKTRFELRGDGPVLVRLPEINFIDDKAGKPVGIHQHIGRRPIAAFGNSDGDLQMLQWTSGGEGRRLAVLIHHTDEVREWAYDRDSQVGRLDKALEVADRSGWTVVDMKTDWRKVYHFDPDGRARQESAD